MGADNLDLDYIYKNIVGGFGKWQLRVTVLVTISWLVVGVILFLNVFTTFTPDHRCYIPECDNDVSGFNESFVEFTIPKRQKINNFLKEEINLNPCQRYAIKSPGLSCTPESFDLDVTEKCGSYVWDETYWGESIATINNLVCEQDNLKRLGGTVLLLGLLVGSIIGGKFGDNYGRKLALQCSMILVASLTIVMGFTTNFPLYLFFNFLLPLGTVTAWICGFALTVEFFDPDHRNAVVSVLDFPFATLSTAALAHFTRQWAWLHWASGGLCLVFMPTIFFMPESPRWLVSKGRLDEALEIFKTVARVNGKNVSEADEKTIVKILETIQIETKEKSLGTIHMFKSGYLSRTLILFLGWTMASLGTYGLAFSSSRLSGDLVLNYFLIMLVDILVALFVYMTISTIGRPKAMTLSCMFLGIPTVIIALISKDQTTLILVLYLLGKFGSGAAFVLVYTITTEVYPTDMRSQALGTCSMVARITSLGSAYISKLSEIWGPLPMLALGVPTIITGLLSLLLPESKGRVLPQTFEEGLKMSKSRQDKEVK